MIDIRQIPANYLIKNAIDCFQMSIISTSAGLCIYKDTNDNFYIHNYTLIRRHSQMKMISGTQLEPNTEPFNGTLEGVPITAALNWTQSDKQLVYFFAGRHLCTQEISFNRVPMCKIKDISDLIVGCSHEDNSTSLSTQYNTHNSTDLYPYTTDQTPYETDYTLIVVISSIVTLILFIVALVLVFVYIKRNEDKPKEEPTLRYIDNKSTEHLRSDIPSPKPMISESNDSFTFNTVSSNASNN